MWRKDILGQRTTTKDYKNMVLVEKSFAIICWDTKTYHQCSRKNQRNAASLIWRCKHNQNKCGCIYSYSTNIINNARVYPKEVTTIKEKLIHTQVKAYRHSDGWKLCWKHSKLITTFQSYISTWMEWVQAW